VGTAVNLLNVVVCRCFSTVRAAEFCQQISDVNNHRLLLAAAAVSQWCSSVLSGSIVYWLSCRTDQAFVNMFHVEGCYTVVMLFQKGHMACKNVLQQSRKFFIGIQIKMICFSEVTLLMSVGH